MEYKYDWIKLKSEWLSAPELELKAFLERTIGKGQDNDGNVQLQTKGWVDAKKEHRQREVDAIAEQTRKELIDKLKVKIEEVLAAKNISFNLLTTYLNCHAKKVAGQALSEGEQYLLDNLPIGKLDTINKWLFIELGLPTNITELQGNKDKPLDLIKMLEEGRKAKEEMEKKEDAKPE
jgi:hypothetical protein